MQLYYFVGSHLNQCGLTSGGRVINQPDPINSADAATKNYVDHRLSYYKETTISLIGTNVATLTPNPSSVLIRLQIFPVYVGTSDTGPIGPTGVYQLNRVFASAVSGSSTSSVIPPAVVTVESYAPGGQNKDCMLQVSWPSQQSINIQKSDAQCDGDYVVLQYG